MSRLCLTGATGFVGGALAKALVAQGRDVHALFRPGADRGSLDGLPIKWHQGDVTQSETLDGLVSGASEIVHAAGRLGQAGVSQSEYLETNTQGLANLIAAIQRTGGQARILHVSTTGVTGPSNAGLADEAAPLAPETAYERSKAAAEQLARKFAQQGFDIVIARPGFLYGPGDRHVLGLFRAIEMGRFFYVDGGRHFCHPTFISDAVKGILLCLERGRTGESYNITGPEPVTFRRFVETAAAALKVSRPSISLPTMAAWLMAATMEGLFLAANRTSPLSRAGVAFFSHSRTASWQKAKTELGYVPQSDLPAGMIETIDWYRQQGWLATLKN